MKRALALALLLSGCASMPEHGSADFYATAPRCSSIQDTQFMVEASGLRGDARDMIHDDFEQENFCTLEDHES